MKFNVLQVPSLEHNNEVKGESLELVKYIDSNFEGPSLLPDVSREVPFDTIFIHFFYLLF